MNKSFSYYSLIMLFLIFAVFSNCGIEKNQNLGFLSFEDFVCGSANKVAEVSTTNDYLYDWQLDGNKLKLDFRFNAVCGSAYGDRVITGDNTIHIFLDDTASVHARCICEHQSVFWFFIEDIENIGLILDIKFYASDKYTTCVDTLLQLY